MSDGGKQGMSDLEMVKLCAEAMDYTGICEGADRTLDGKPFPGDPLKVFTSETHAYDPLTNDAQCFALVKRFGLFLGRFSEGYWCVDSPKQQEQTCSFRDSDLNRAVVECVAKMQATALSTGRAPSTATTK